MTKARGKILLIDDEPNALRVLSAILRAEGYAVLESQNVENALEYIQNSDIDTVITDVKMPGQDGMQLFEHVSERFQDIPVIFLTAYGSVDSAVHAISRGAFYYFIKPPDYAKLKGILAHAVEQRFLKREIETLRKRLAMGGHSEHMIGNSPPMARIHETIDAVKDTVSSVLIHGETGTGKELIARSLHFNSSRKDKPFITVNCAAMPSGLLESELFGYEKGAFTGAASRRLGKFEEAADGTIFLDEIGEMELQLQAKILRVIQEKEIERLGSNKKVRINFRLICSTNRDLVQEIKAGKFREDLFYRVNVVNIHVPPLRERKEDIPLLAAEFLKEYCVREKKTLKLSQEAMDAVSRYHWPGNIRQLKNLMERVVVLAKGRKVTLEELPDELRGPVKTACASSTGIRSLRELELEAILAALREFKGNKSKVAEHLGISRKALYQRLRTLPLREAEIV
jgi:DNA-binding NtrC family response regulator